MFTPPKNSPWGEVDYCDILCPGVFLVYTPSHGGIMVARDVEEFLSPAARKLGSRKNGYLCYEEDCDEAVVFRELLDKKLWSIPERIKNRALYEETLNNEIRLNHPRYWRSRENGRAHAPPALSVIAHKDR